MLATVLGVIGVALNQVFIWPQVWRARSDVEGVAALTALTGLLARAAWTVYGIVIADAALILGNLTVAIGFGLLLALLGRADSAHAAGLVTGAAAVLTLVAAAALARPVLAILAVVSAGLVNLPQMLRALADRRRLAGVSALTYWLIATASTCWLLYGIVVGDLVISAPHFVLLPTAIITATLASATDSARASTAQR